MSIPTDRVYEGSDKAMTRTVALAVALVHASCVTVQERTPKRADVVRTAPIKTSTTVVTRLDIHEPTYTAHVRGTAKTCGDYELTYAMAEEQQITTMGAARVAVGSGLTFAASTVLLLFAADIIPHELGPAALVPGVLGLLIGAGVAISGVVGKRSTRTVPVLATEHETVNKCEEAPHTASGAQEWRVNLDGLERTGTTGPGGTLDLRAVLADLLASRIADDADARALHAGKSLSATFVLGDAPPVTRDMTVDQIPPIVLSRWAQLQSRKLTGKPALRWDGCGFVTNTARDQLRCYFEPGTHLSRMMTLEGEIGPVAGRFGGIAAFRGSYGMSFQLQVAVPKRPPDWHVQVTNTTTSSVLDEDFTGRGQRLQLTGRFQQSGEHVLLIDAAARGRFDALLAIRDEPLPSPKVQMLFVDYAEVSTTELDDRYDLPWPAGEYEIEIRSEDCAIDASVLDPATAVELDGVRALTTRASEDPKLAGQNLTEVRLSLERQEPRYQLHLKPAPGESTWCRYDLVARSVAQGGQGT